MLVDVRAGRVKQVGLRDYALFVLFFPPLIAGPIVHYRELVPQFRGAGRTAALRGFRGRVDTVLYRPVQEDQFPRIPIAVLIEPAWSQAASGHDLGLLQAWAAVLGFLLQLYFDFSGYSDMAIGAARLFGISCRTISISLQGNQRH